MSRGYNKSAGFGARETKAAKEARSNAQWSAAKIAEKRAAIEAAQKEIESLTGDINLALHKAESEDARERAIVLKLQRQEAPWNKVSSSISKMLSGGQGSMNDELSERTFAKAKDYVSKQGLESAYADWTQRKGGYDSEYFRGWFDKADEKQRLYEFLRSKNRNGIEHGSRMEAIDDYLRDHDVELRSIKSVEKDAMQVLKEYMPHRKASDFSLFGNEAQYKDAGFESAIGELKSAPEEIKTVARAYLSSKLLDTSIKYEKADADSNSYKAYNRKALNYKGFPYEKQTSRNLEKARDKQLENVRKIEKYIASLS